jgi:hypothetical protein
MYGKPQAWRQGRIRSDSRHGQSCLQQQSRQVCLRVFSEWPWRTGTSRISEKHSQNVSGRFLITGCICELMKKNPATISSDMPITAKNLPWSMSSNISECNIVPRFIKFSWSDDGSIIAVKQIEAAIGRLYILRILLRLRLPAVCLLRKWHGLLPYLSMPCRATNP